MKNTNRKSTPKEAKKATTRKTFQEDCQERLTLLREQEFERRATLSREAHRGEEDEMMLLVYGPNWRHTA